MKPLILISVAAFAISATFAQSVIPQNLRASLSLQSLGNTISRISDIGVYGIPLEIGNIVGDIYLEEDWKETNLLMYDQEKLISNVRTRLDVHNQGLEIKLKDETRFIENRLIKSYVWSDGVSTARFFVNSREYKSKSFTLDGFLEVLVDGNLSLLKQTFTKIKQPDYNVALSVGSRDTKIIKASRYFILDRNVIYELPPNRNKAVEILKNHGFPKSLKTRDIKNEEALINTFLLLNKKKDVK